MDGYVLQTNVHFPTDVNLLWDSGRKGLDMIQKACEEAGHMLPGWRKINDWYKKLRNQERQLTRTLSKGGKNREVRVEYQTRKYLSIAEKIHDKLKASEQILSQYSSVKMLAISASLAHYQDLLLKHIDLVGRRLLEGETIAHKDKLFSIFEPHTQWINKGKTHPKVELGMNLVIATDQHHFILHHQLLENEHEVEVALPFAQKICKIYNEKNFKASVLIRISTPSPIMKI